MKKVFILLLSVFLLIGMVSASIGPVGQIAQITPPGVQVSGGQSASVSAISHGTVKSPVPEVVHNEMPVSPGNGLVSHEAVGASCASCYNRPPVVDIGDDFTIYSGQRVTLHVNAYDPDGDRMYPTWYATAGYLSSRNSFSPTYTAPQVRSATTLSITCSVRDSRGAMGTDRVYVTVIPGSGPIPGQNRNPTVTISGTATVNSGDLIRVSVSASDPDGDRLSYSWYATEGALSNPSGTSTTVTTPTFINTPRRMVVMVTVTDGKGGISSDSLQVTVMPVNSGTEPVITMPSTASVRAGGTISINPTVTSPKGLPLRYVWYCTQGSISNINSKNIVFTAPNNPGTVVICNLIAVDSEEGNGSNFIKITVT
ncbi:MAG: hypothetical protein MNSN_11020 [Minisyncoccus archaeiphilus]|uniref:PKD domain-containing protein n=1 Tax=Minisyncoccus archaeiphilus TaxID=3238481 RepID=UPI0009D0A79C|nr:MAG: Chitinase A precursor [Parcubacteria group bacterium ADurb.Bin216]GMX60075.1 MAG: hypothetical protein MNSN_11020 [Candidatus Parcubacteria bacterium]